MGAKRRVVVAGPSGCRILTNPRKEDYAGLAHVIDPDLSNVSGTSPENWILSSGSVRLKPGVKKPVLFTGTVSEDHAAIIRASSFEVRCAVILSIVSIVFALASIVLKFR